MSGCKQVKRSASVALVLSLLTSCHAASGGSHNICGGYNGRRLYLETGERGTLTADNATTGGARDKCRLDLVTCPACVISVVFRHLDLPRRCAGGGGVPAAGAPGGHACHCGVVRLSEPPYDAASQVQFCGAHPSPSAALPAYRSLTRTLAVALLYSEPHQHAFTLEYAVERNRQLLNDSVGGVVASGNSTDGDVLKSPFFPSPYPRDLGIEYIISCHPGRSANCRIRLLFEDFHLSADSIIEFFDWNGQRLEVSSGMVFRPPVIISSGPSLLVRFYANGGTDIGYKATYSFLTSNFEDKIIKPITDCGGYVENPGGAITMMNMVEVGMKRYDCVWLIRPPQHFLQLKTHLYLKVEAFFDMGGGTELTIIQGLTSEQPVLDMLRYPMAGSRGRELVVPISDGFYVSLRGSFGPASRLAVIYAAFSYMDCYTSFDFPCKNHRCIPSQLHCDGFDHCGDNSDEPENCYKEWALETRDRRWYSHTPNYYFPKMAPYPDLKTATLVFVISSTGLIFLISAMIILLYRLGARARQQRELQNQLRTISDLLDDALHDDVQPDDPPVYEAPPDYDEVIKVFLDAAGNQRRRKRRNIRKQQSIRSRSCPRSNTQSNISMVRNALLNIPSSSAGCSAQGQASRPVLGQLTVNLQGITSRSCQTTPLPDSPPPPYAPTPCPSVLSRVHSEGDLISRELERGFPGAGQSCRIASPESGGSSPPDSLPPSVNSEDSRPSSRPLHVGHHSFDFLVERTVGPSRLPHRFRPSAAVAPLGGRLSPPALAKACSCAGECGCLRAGPQRHARSFSVDAAVLMSPFV
ncbi:uncharacterized protein LOC134533420 [Bacillus rossius redtenbacheri]|uniref:uncharacterized protein LOC134533420 n=1 Tax=Bacillus rossius redtenbacheri TaxID=93214 RepID=UPI002FDECA0D